MQDIYSLKGELSVDKNELISSMLSFKDNIGIDISGKYIEVPFIGMDDEEVKVIAEDFDGFIDYVWNRK